MVSLSGDGGFTMLMGDLLSLRQLELPAKVVVFNNGALGFIELEQKSTGFLNTGTDLLEPELRRDGRGGRHQGRAHRGPGRGGGPARRGAGASGPVLVDAVVSRHELAMPPKITAEMAKGFTLYMVRAVLNGRLDEVIELAMANVRR